MIKGFGKSHRQRVLAALPKNVGSLALPPFTDDTSDGLHTLMQLNGGYYPASFAYAGTTAYVSNGGLDFRGLRHAIRANDDLSMLRFELHNTTSDRRAADLPDTRRRDEIGFNDIRLVKGQKYWCALSVRPHAYAKPDSMAQTSTLAGLCLQIKGDDEHSASIGWRRTNSDQFAVSTVGGVDTSQGATRYNQPWTLDVWHDLVMGFVAHDTDGSVDLFMDGALILSVSGISTAPSAYGNGSYMKTGVYDSGGLGPDPLSTVITDVGNPCPPQIASLMSRVSARPAMPA